VRAEGVQLESLRPQPLKEQVIGQLRRLVEDGVLQPGDQLPSERELSEQLQVSRGTVREAVQFLHALGLVEIRHGSGTFITSARDVHELRREWQRWTLGHSARIHDLLEVRRGLESFAAELASTRLVRDGLDAMADAIAQMKAATDDVAALVQADVAFHRALCETAGNAALIELAGALGQQLLRERATLWDTPGRPARSREEHMSIYEAIKAGDAPRARACVLEHLTSVERDIDGLVARLSDGGRAAKTKRRKR
jgi:GntR family transcriptional repressor for pyruvate dehydrogenase complex